ncbi:MAG: hypothetical protein IPL28_05375 [Chloroflexi bacterium]|nr:hypothetical protein [Chloroflexota bacterium]
MSQNTPSTGNLCTRSIVAFGSIAFLAVAGGAVAVEQVAAFFQFRGLRMRPPNGLNGLAHAERHSRR